MSYNNKEFPIDKYKFYIAENKNKVLATSTYAGKTIRGVAICADSDTFDLEKGKQLAAARCNAKVAAKRLANAKEYYNYLNETLSMLQEEFAKACDYYTDAATKFSNANKKLDDLISSM